MKRRGFWERAQSWAALGDTFAIMAFGLGTVVPIPVIKVYDIQINTNPVKRGQTLHYQVHYYKYLPLPARVSKTLVNGVVIPSEPCASNAPTGEHTVGATYKVPNTSMAIGTRKLRISYEYDLGFRVIAYTYETPTFEVE